MVEEKRYRQECSHTGAKREKYLHKMGNVTESQGAHGQSGGSNFGCGGV